MSKLVELAQFLWPVLVTALLPFVVAWVSQANWSGDTKSLVALVFSGFVGIVALLTQNLVLSPDTLVLAVMAVYGGVKLAYLAFKKMSITNAWLEALLEIGSQAATPQIK